MRTPADTHVEAETDTHAEMHAEVRAEMHAEMHAEPLEAPPGLHAEITVEAADIEADTIR